MKKSVLEIIETFFLIYYVLFPFYLFYLIAFDGDSYHYSSFNEFVPSFYFCLFPVLYYSFRKRVNAIQKIIIALLLISHILITYLLFYFLTTEEESNLYMLPKLISFIGISLTLLLLIFHRGKASSKD